MQEHIVLRYIGQFKDPLIMLLLASAALSIIVGQYDDALSIAAAVIIVGSVGFYQEYKSEQSLEALNTLVPPRCNVLRGGKVLNTLAEDLVPGDIIKLAAGDRVPADARIIKCISLAADESNLTGETKPREKISQPLPDLRDDGEVAAVVNSVFMGTLICSGHATAIVVATAAETEFGKTFQEMKDIESKRSPLQHKMDELGQKLSVFSMGIIVCIGLLGIFQGQKVMAMFNIGVSLAVAAIPEGLPICVTVTLALGVMRMAQKNAIVKRLPAVEALGCANYICTDKTGTLTENCMTVISVYCPALDDVIQIKDARPISTKKRSYGSSLNLALQSELNTIEVGGSAGSGGSGSGGSSSGSGGAASDGPTLILYHGQEMLPAAVPCLARLFDAACLCNNASLYDAVVTGQPTEGALLVASKQLGVPDRRPLMQRVHEEAFRSESKYMSTTYEESGRKVQYMKGALEVILPQCVTCLDAVGELVLLSAAVKERVLQHSMDMSRTGLRVLGIAFGEQHNQLTLCGIVGLMDPLREGVVEGVHRIQSSGARVMMITGDSEATAVSIAKMAGVIDPATHRK